MLAMSSMIVAICGLEKSDAKNDQQSNKAKEEEEAQAANSTSLEEVTFRNTNNKSATNTRANATRNSNNNKDLTNWQRLNQVATQVYEATHKVNDLRLMIDVAMQIENLLEASHTSLATSK